MLDVIDASMEERVETLEQRLVHLEGELQTVKENMPDDQLSMVVFSGDLDRILAAFIIATGAAAMYEKVVMFFTFWGTSVLRDLKKTVTKNDLTARMFGQMLPKGAGQLKLSQMHMAGVGTRMLKSLMKKKGVMSLEDLMKTAAEFGVEIIICEMSMDLMGFSMDEFIDYPNVSLAGAANFLGEAAKSKVTLFI
ncbi:MAG: DsrE/DsrF/DrsH-like family protein [Desulfobacterales bacterium]|jgi:peroxiredoxin family protein|nr:DsrE/DsrF/DrsH-like family protein [Desulfobacterales bacterium]MDP4978790.1 DsrE/DsrF/DrsH-like family protein [Desulfobacterales bacterium]